MSRYLILVDRSMSFDDLLNLKTGDTFYEVDMGFVAKGVLTTDAVRHIEGDYDTVRYEATVYDFDNKSLEFIEREEDVSYLSTRNLMHYGGKFYADLNFFDRENQTVVELKDVQKKE